jgi:hypothetical protein
MSANIGTDVDQTLKDSFPASDPPSWNQGRQQTQDARKKNEVKSDGAEPAPVIQKSPTKDKRIQIGPTDIS